jgi:hypothetical protein
MDTFADLQHALSLRGLTLTVAWNRDRSRWEAACCQTLSLHAHGHGDTIPDAISRALVVWDTMNAEGE